MSKPVLCEATLILFMEEGQKFFSQPRVRLIAVVRYLIKRMFGLSVNGSIRS